ncbi:MAG: YfhO family protein [Bacteroidota bacterium]
MKNQNKIAITVFISIAIFALINLIYFRHGLSGDKVLNQGDVMNFKGAAKEIQDFRADTGKEALWTNSMFGGMPAYQISVHYANRALGFINSTLQLFLPQPLGMVFLYMIGFFILMLCLKIDPWIGLICSLGFAFSSYFFIIIEAGHNTKAVAIAYAPPLLGGIMLILRQKWVLGFVLTTLFMGLEIYANHPQITYYMFLLFSLIIIVESIKIITRKHFLELTKSLALIVVALGIGVLPNISSLWTTAEYGKFTTRGPSELSIKEDGSKNNDKEGLPIDYATDWSYGVGESFTLLIPNFKGGATGSIADNVSDKALSDIDSNYYDNVTQSNIYFGDQPFTSGPVYAGAIILFLALSAFFLIKNPIKWALLAGLIFSLLLSWGRNFPELTDWFFQNFPLYNKFRAVSMLLVVAELVIPLLAALALNEIVHKENEITYTNKNNFLNSNFKKAIVISSGVLLVFLTSAYVAPSLFNTFHSQKESVQEYEKSVKKELAEREKSKSPNMSDIAINQKINPQVMQYLEGYKKFLPELEKPRISIFRKDVARSLGFILVAAALIFLFADGKISRNIILPSLGILILIDMWMINSRYLNEDSYKDKNEETEFAQNPADNFILQDKSPDFRVVSTAVNTFNNSTVSYFHKSIGGYHGAKLKRFQEIRDFHIDKELSIASQLADAGVGDSIATEYLNRTCPVLNMLNTRYVITQKNAGAKPFLNKSANGNAWSVNQIQWAPNADSEIVWTGKINSKVTAVINEKKYKDQLKGWENISSGEPAKINLNEYQPNYLNYSYESNKNQFLVFSEIWYPAGWNAYVDGVLTPHVCANYILRGMMVPSGKHKIEFKFEPKSYITGEKISFAGVMAYYFIIVGGFGFLGFKQLRKK